MRALRRFSSVLIALAATLSVADAEDSMPWQPSLEAARQMAAQTNRLVLIHFWAPWCKPCLRLDKEVFSHPETARALEASFVLVKLNVDEAPATARLYGVSSLPADVIALPNGRLVSQLQSPPTASQYVAQINQAAAGHRELVRRSMQPPVGPQIPQVAAGVAPPMVTAQATPNAPVISPGLGPATQPGPPAQAAYANDRYADYFRQQSGQPPQNNAPPTNGYAPPPTNGYATPPANVQPLGAPSIPVATQVNPQPPTAATGPPNGAPPSARPNYNSQASYQPQPPLPQLPPGCPPLGLDGNCPVTLVERKQWSLGDKAWGVVHRGRTYIFQGPAEKERFLVNPDRYSPVLSGIDPVLALDHQMTVPGRREFGVFGADSRIYLFADEASLKRFVQNEKRYAAEAIQAMR